MMAVDLTEKFMRILIESGVAPAQVAYEGYTFALATMTDYKTSINMEVAANVMQEATLKIGIHPTQLKQGMEQRYGATSE